jgi:hypothetical protein
VLFHFRFNAFWLAAFCYANGIFLMEKSFLIHVFLIYIHFSETQIRRKTRDGCPILKTMLVRLFEVPVNVYQATKRNLGKELMFCTGNWKLRKQEITDRTGI